MNTTAGDEGRGHTPQSCPRSPAGARHRLSVQRKPRQDKPLPRSPPGSLRCAAGSRAAGGCVFWEATAAESREPGTCRAPLLAAASSPTESPQTCRSGTGTGGRAPPRFIPEYVMSKPAAGEPGEGPASPGDTSGGCFVCEKGALCAAASSPAGGSGARGCGRLPRPGAGSGRPGEKRGDSEPTPPVSLPRSPCLQTPPRGRLPARAPPPALLHGPSFPHTPSFRLPPPQQRRGRAGVFPLSRMGDAQSSLIRQQTREVRKKALINHRRPPPGAASRAAPFRRTAAGAQRRAGSAPSGPQVPAPPGREGGRWGRS